MANTVSFNSILSQYRKSSFSERDKGDRFEKLMQAYLQTDPQYASRFSKVWMWNEFPGKKDFGGKDTGIDLVAKTVEGDYWAIQCKCVAEDTTVDKPALDSFLSTSSRMFKDDDLKTTSFSHRLWISTSNHWGANAELAIQNQNPPVSRLSLAQLENAPVDWSTLEKGQVGEVARTGKYPLKPHQQTAMNAAHEHFKTSDRGKMIMACGTGKTFTSLRIAENETKGQGLILFLVPSISLLGQTLREWSSQANEDINAICICSDSGVSRKRVSNDDSDTASVVDLALPASTNVKGVVKQFKSLAKSKHSGMTVVFSTYQSIEVIAEAQKELSKDNIQSEFDLIICDEAHRTTGVTLANTDASSFVKVHDNNFLRAKKRLYMTATPRLYNEDSKSKAAQADATLCSMDEPKFYGEEFYRIGFGEAVEKDLLSDYKVIILTISETDVPAAVQRMISGLDLEIQADDPSKLIGCINGLSKKMLGDAGLLKESDPEPMRRAVAFCQNIKISKAISTVLNETRDVYLNSLTPNVRETLVKVHAEHVDGAMPSPLRDEKLSWLKNADAVPGECRVLTNVRCLSEGVDVPSLDAVLFLSPRNSQVDVVQSVGRVMRKAPGKKYGYIIIPVVVPVDVKAEVALDNNEKYKVVWSVLNALRAHDDRFNATINKIELNKKRPGQILVGRTAFDVNGDLIAADEGEAYGKHANEMSRQMAMQFQELQSVVFARMVEKVGDRRYWEQWAKDVGQIAERHVARIRKLVREDNKHQKAFENFLKGLQKNINPSIDADQAIEMLAQHIITKPVFEALFEGYSFVKNNAISVSMQSMLDLLEQQSLDKDAETLFKFYESVKKRAADIDNAEGKQRIIVELYDKFFKTAFPKMVEKLGIVYTPVEVVDFIIHSVEDILQKEFGRSISDENIHILDPFTGTGTFMTRLLQSGIIKPEDLDRKYAKELHANEIVLLAYYIAAINIENAYHDQTPDPDDGIGKSKYVPFEGIVLTDTFQLGETDDGEKLFSEMFPQNSKRVQAQKKAPLRVIIGNPPYSVGQKSANDNAQNQTYTKLEKRISETYAAATEATLKNSLYDSYIKAFRWSTDRLDQKNGGVIAFVSNGAWIDGNSANGFRKCLEKEFSSIHVFNLRGNARTSGELRQKEAGNVFGVGSRTAISITFLIKNPNNQIPKATIQYVDIGDYLSQSEKLLKVKNLNSISSNELKWKTLNPDEHGDWLNQRSSGFADFIALGDKDDQDSNSFFVPFYGRGLATSRDAWCYNFSKDKLSENIKRTISFYNLQVQAFVEERTKNPNIKVEDFIDTDSTKISWDRAQKNDLPKNKLYSYDQNSIYQSLYRPYCKQYAYFNRQLNNCVYKLPSAFPNALAENRLICVSGVGVTKEFTAIMVNSLPDLELVGKSQCFPLYYYSEDKAKSIGLFDADDVGSEKRKEAISDWAFNRAKALYGNAVNKEDLFYYLYGLLHNSDYREMYSSDLKKMLPRLPLIEDVRAFWSFSKAGRALADLHINYEKVPPFEDVRVNGASSGNFHVEKMRFPKKDQKDTILYNSMITIENIPAKAYEYVVNGKSAIEWIMERYQITTHKESGIVNDPNDWAKEVANPRYILDLLLSVINVSVKTVEIVEGLPKVKFE